MNVSKHIIAGLTGKSILPVERDLILKHKVLGFILYSRNIGTAEALKEFTKELKALGKQAGYKLLLSIDQEGGRVKRLPDPYTQPPTMRSLGQDYVLTRNKHKVYEWGKTIAREVKEAGFDLNFAPLVDVDINADNPIIGDRSFSADPNIVTFLSIAIIQGMMAEGVLTCIKHFPGHGATEKDSHLELPVDHRKFDDMQMVDLIPYRTLIAKNIVQSIMTAHVMYPNIDPDYPATLSKIIIHDILRKGLNYDGLVLSDDLLMKAIRDNYDLAEATKRFFEISGDVALICAEPEVVTEVIEKLDKENIDLSQQAKRVSLFQN